MSTSRNEDKSISTTLESHSRPAKSPSLHRIPKENMAVIKDCDEFVDHTRKKPNLKQPCTQRLKDELLKWSEMILQQQKQLLSCISKQLKASTQKSNVHQAEGKESGRNDKQTLLSHLNSEKVSKRKKGLKN
jgi:hypothetical protein